MRDVLLVGMGFGQAVYMPVLKSMNFNVVTVDKYLPADFTTVEEAIAKHGKFNLVHICTPNNTHESITETVADNARIIFVEKPGVSDSLSWFKLARKYPNTKVVMTKNNQYRNEINYFKQLAKVSNTVKIFWHNTNRIPKPGSWFTDKSQAFGGVSRDLMPHLLSYFTHFTDYKEAKKVLVDCKQRYTLDSIKSSNYGSVNKDGIYDVDDFCEIHFEFDNTKYILSADWASNLGYDDISIDFDGRRFELGLCPEEAYYKMIDTAVRNYYNNDYWENQLEQDVWIHRQLEVL
jgi:predicted dehydrogenase